MLTMRNALALILLALLLNVTSGCTSASREPFLRSSADFSPEHHRMWTRPNEVGYTFGSRVQVDISHTKFLGLTVEGEKPGDARVVGFVTSLIAGQDIDVEDPLIRHAAAKAIDQAHADGIYVLRADLRTFGWWPLLVKRTATVRGIALTLVDMGPVDEKRADEERFLRLKPTQVNIRTE